jgi:cell filamentation protein
MQNIDELSKKRAYELWDTGDIKKIDAGTVKGLRQIHKYLFSGLYSFAGIIRDKNIAKGNFRFASSLYLQESLDKVEQMPEDDFGRIIEKYVELNICHPFLDGNGRAIRIWLDLALKRALKKCIDWQKVDRTLYLQAMERSPVNDLEIKTVLHKALTEKIYDRTVFIKGIDQSYYYENYQ